MTTIKFHGAMIEVDAGVLAQAFRIGTDDLQRGMRAGTITSRCERGEGTDAGRVRLTFYAPDRRVRVIADDSGRILTCTAADHARRESPPAADGTAEDGANDGAEAEHRARLDALLDEALACTFPASDPIALDFGHTDTEAPAPSSPPAGERHDR